MGNEPDPGALWARRAPRRYLLPLALTGALAAAVGYLVSPAGALRPPPPPTPPAPTAPPTVTAPAPAETPAASAAPPTVLLEGRQEVPVLMYHDVTDRPSVYFDVPTGTFRRHLEQLREAGARPISLAQLHNHLAAGASLPPRAVLLTFDDGYLGQLRFAYPLLKRFGFPAAFFVHTAVIGRRTGKDHMTWAQLQALDREGLVTIESHTVSHPEDLRLCSDAALERELRESKRLLEEKLGRPVRFLAYPVGNADGRVARAARAAGYELAFTMGPGWAASPADAFFVPRLNPRYLSDVAARLPAASVQPYRSVVAKLAEAPLESGLTEDGQVRLRWVRGGRMSGVCLRGRRSVPDLVRASGASAGLNGTFFSDARVNSAGAGIVGPVRSRFGPGFAPGLPGDRDRIAGRPFVVMAPGRIAFLPFQPRLAFDAEGVERLLPGATDCFVAGAWLIHEGRALSREEMEGFRLENMFDFRPRAFVGVDRQGRPFLGASSTGNQSDRLAETLVQLGLAECVLLDSGFSTSLVLGREVLVSGIRRTDMPARPVPHVLLLHALDPEARTEVVAYHRMAVGVYGPPNVPSLARLQAEAEREQTVSPADSAEQRRPHRRRYRRQRRHRQ